MAELSPKLRMPVAGLGAVMTLSGVVGALLAARTSPLAYSTLGFELVIAIGGIALTVGVLRTGLRSGAAIGLAAVGGVWVASSLLGRFAWHVVQSGGDISPTAAMMREASDPWVLGRCASGAFLGLLAITSVLRKDGARWRSLILGSAMAGVPLAAGLWALTAGQGYVLAPATTGSDAIRVGVLLVGGIALAVLFSVGVQWIVSAFEENRPTPA